jgi:aminopeptidase N
MLRYLLGKIRSPSFSSLSKIDSEIRASLIKKNSIEYNFHLTLHKGSLYDGLSNITFQAYDLNREGEIRIDFQGKHLKRILVNSEEISAKKHEGYILIPQKHIKERDWNNIAIEYSNEYDKDGNGCVSFIDVDQKQYLYTQFEPYFANRVFPLFDQPDLKAPMTLTLSCPNEW